MMPHRAMDSDERLEAMADEWGRHSERISALEVEIRHLKGRLDEKFDDLSAGNRATGQKVQEMYDLLMQARGAKWAIVGAAGVAGFVSGKIGTALLTLFGVKL